MRAAGQGFPGYPPAKRIHRYNQVMLTSLSRTGISRRSSSSLWPVHAPGRLDTAPTSMMSAPSLPHLQGTLQGSAGLQIAPAIGKGIRGDIENPHNVGAFPQPQSVPPGKCMPGAGPSQALQNPIDVLGRCRRPRTGLQSSEGPAGTAARSPLIKHRFHPGRKPTRRLTAASAPLPAFLVLLYSRQPGKPPPASESYEKLPGPT